MVGPPTGSAAENHAAARPPAAKNFGRLVNSFRILLIIAMLLITTHLASVVIQLLKPAAASVPDGASSFVAPMENCRWVPAGLTPADRSAQALTNSDFVSQLGNHLVLESGILNASNESLKSSAGNEFPFARLGTVLMQRHTEQGSVDGWVLEMQKPNGKLPDILKQLPATWSHSVTKNEYYVESADGREYVMVPGEGTTGRQILTILKVD